MTEFNLEIFTPTGKLLAEQVQSVKIPTVAGEVQVLPGHVGYVAVLGTGLLEYESSTAGTTSSKRLAVSCGFVSFLAGTLSILTDSAVLPSRVDSGYADERNALVEFLRAAVYDAPETERARQRLALINSIDSLISN